MKPSPEPIEPEKLLQLAQAVIENDPFPYLASMDEDQPRVRPVSPVRTEGFTVFVANLRMYHKTQEIAANPKVELCYLDEHHNQVRITGLADVLTDKELIRDIWENHNLLRQFMPDPFDSNLIIHRIEPKRVRYMQEWALQYYDVPIPDPT